MENSHFFFFFLKHECENLMTAIIVISLNPVIFRSQLNWVYPQIFELDYQDLHLFTFLKFQIHRNFLTMAQGDIEGLNKQAVLY